MTFRRNSGGGIIFLSFVTALTLTITPLPELARMLRPELVAMVLIYWCMALPERMGVGIAWCAGIMLDVAQGALLGQHALALVLVAWVTLQLHKRFRVFPMWQQAMSVLLLVILSQMVVLWVKGTMDRSPQTWWYWLPSLTSMLLWPFLFVLMRNIRRKFKVA